MILMLLNNVLVYYLYSMYFQVLFPLEAKSLVFSSLIFLYIFLPLNLLIYFLSKNQVYRNWVLIIFSLCFYAWGEPVWISILIFSALIDYFHGLIAEKYRGHWQSKAALISSLLVNLSLLGFFKYSSFFVQNFNFLFGINLPFHEFALPIGISFYTFQTLSYVIDVYKGEVSAQKSPYKLLLFVSLFHQLVAGPIVRYKDVASQIDNRLHSLSLFDQGIKRFVIGLGKKVILANTAGEIAEVFLNGNLSTLPVLGAWFGIILFALQIYFDFSGYSDMAIGLGKLFGFNYKENFNYPYISRSATEFWRRWHISLGSFFRDYLYIPLGGNKKFHLRNLFIVWFLTGLWHGASWNFVLWGLYYGLLIILEKTFLIKIFDKLPRFISHFYLIITVLIGWVFFYYTNLNTVLEFLKIMFSFGERELINTTLGIYFFNNFLFFVIALIACTPILPAIDEKITCLLGKYIWVYNLYDGFIKPLLILAILATATVLLVGKSYNPFLYFRF